MHLMASAVRGTIIDHVFKRQTCSYGFYDLRTLVSFAPSVPIFQALVTVWFSVIFDLLRAVAICYCDVQGFPHGGPVSVHGFPLRSLAQGPGASLTCPEKGAQCFATLFGAENV
jgi:hypothetical protein